MWLCLIDNDTRHHSGQNLLRTHSAAPRESTTFWPLWWRVSLSIRVHTTLNHIRFVKSATSTRHYSLPNIFFLLLLHVERVWKSFRRVQVTHLHNAACALLSRSRCFQLWTNVDKDFFRYLWYCGKKQIECGLAWSVLLSTTIRIITVVKICCETIFSSGTSTKRETAIFKIYLIHFEITGYSCDVIGSQQCYLFTNRTIFCSKSHLFLSQWE